MNESEHTAGPWTAFQRPAEVGTNYFRILLHGHPDRQDLYGQDSLAGYCGAANARLIAAAPETAAERDRLKAVNADLLAALELLVGEETEDSAVLSNKEKERRARAVLAEAKKPKTAL